MGCSLTPIAETLSPDSLCYFKAKADAFARKKISDPAEAERVAQTIAAIGYLESRFGYVNKWKTEDGDPAWNWGALIALKGQPTVNIPGAPTMRAYESTDAALASFWATWARSDTLAAARRGDTFAVSAAMGAHGYYGPVPPLEYAKTIQGAARSLYGEGVKIEVKEPSKFGFLLPLGIALAGVSLLWYLAKRR